MQRRAKHRGVDLSGAKKRTIPALATMHVRVGFNLSIPTPRAGAEASVTGKFSVFATRVFRLIGNGCSCSVARAEITWD
jgi:hypothetical protein